MIVMFFWYMCFKNNFFNTFNLHSNCFYLSFVFAVFSDFRILS